MEIDLPTNIRSLASAKAFIESRYPYLVGNVDYRLVEEQEFIDGEFLTYVAGVEIQLLDSDELFEASCLAQEYGDGE